MFEELCKELSTLECIEALALGGSRITSNYDENSDYDLYVYCKEFPSIKDREDILSKYCHYREMHNTFWEMEDDCTMNNGIDIDIIYRKIEDLDSVLDSVVNKYNAYNGYTTCMWYNISTCKILYDSSNRLHILQDKYNVPYPKELKHNIIHKNMQLLHGLLCSYDRQIEKAIERNDLVSVNHRITAYLESYFDILFALNEMKHPGEKRMVSYLMAQGVLPNKFKENVDRLFEDIYGNLTSVLEDIDTIYTELKLLVEKEEIL